MRNQECARNVKQTLLTSALLAAVFVVAVGTAKGCEWNALPLGEVCPGGVFGGRIAMTVTNNRVKADYDNDFIKPFVDTEATITYFRAPNLKTTVRDDDELFCQGSSTNGQ